MRRSSTLFLVVLGLATVVLGAATQQGVPETAREAYEKSEYDKAIFILKNAVEKDPANGEIHLLLAQSHLEAKQFDEAIKSGEKAVAIDPKNSVYRRWLGDAYAQKADHASLLSAYSLARKAQKELETAVQLDERNFDAAQDLIEYNCTAPGIAGGGVDKAQVLIKKVMALDAAEGHFGAGTCKSAKKDFPAADAEFAQALESKLKSADRLFDIGHYFMLRGNGDAVLNVVKHGEAQMPKDPRAKYYRAVGWVMQDQNDAEAEKLLSEYLRVAPLRNTYPPLWWVHYWLGRAYESQKESAKAKEQYREALKVNPKFKKAQDSLKQLGG